MKVGVVSQGRDAALRAVYLYVCMCVCKYIDVCRYVDMYITYACAYTHTFTCTCTYAYTCAFTYTYTYTYDYMWICPDSEEENPREVAFYSAINRK